MENEARKEIFKTSKLALKKPLNYCNFTVPDYDLVTGEKRGKMTEDGIGMNFESLYDEYSKKKLFDYNTGV